MTKPSPIVYSKTGTTTTHIMWQTLLALTPIILIKAHYQGSRVFALLLIACLSAIFIEGIMLALRKRNITKHLKDGSALLSAILLTLCLPSNLPFWTVFIGIAFALIIGKHLYGGLGMNPFNPAMLGFAFLLLSFPALMGQYPAQAIPLSSIWQNIDLTTSATLLDQSKQMRLAEQNLSTLQIPKEQILLALASLIAGLYLIKQKSIDWKIPFYCLLSALFFATMFYLKNPETYLNPLQQIFAGALFFGAFFIATDPITASTSPLGRILYSILIGALTIAIRNLGNFPDGFAFAILLANACAPLLDQLAPRYR